MTTASRQKQENELSERNPFRFAGLAFLLVGYGSLALGIFFLVANTWFWIVSASTTGTVVGWEYMEMRSRRIRPYRGEPARATVVSFTAKHGEEVVFATDWGSGLNVYTTGEDVTVLYDENDPEQAKIRGFVSLYLGPLLLLVLGAGFWFFGTLAQFFQ
jgi:hypothetical protein